MKYTCPLCEAEMNTCLGDQVHPGSEKHGITLYCPNLKCPAQEVVGHGNNLKDAYEIVTAKFGKKNEK